MKQEETTMTLIERENEKRENETEGRESGDERRKERWKESTPNARYIHAPRKCFNRISRWF